jgi:hypothetical protein
MHEQMALSVPVSSRKSFILDNFPFYSTLLTDFLGRCQSFEFTASVYVILLYRVAKVFVSPTSSPYAWLPMPNKEHSKVA